jgi:hypothetical protein
VWMCNRHLQLITRYTQRHAQNYQCEYKQHANTHQEQRRDTSWRLLFSVLSVCIYMMRMRSQTSFAVAMSCELAVSCVLLRCAVQLCALSTRCLAQACTLAHASQPRCDLCTVCSASGFSSQFLSTSSCSVSMLHAAAAAAAARMNNLCARCMRLLLCL